MDTLPAGVDRSFEILARGVVIAGEPGTARAVAAGSRLVRRPDGSLYCTYMVQSRLSINDFVPVAAISRDDGVTWEGERPLWPHLATAWSIFGSVSQAPDGMLCWFGSRSPIDVPGESFWRDETKGLKQNELVWACSRDQGARWSEPAPIPLPIPGALEVPGPLCVTRSGRWVGCFALYNSFDPAVKVDRAQLGMVASDDAGRTWEYQPLMRFAQPTSGAAEAWVVQLADGRLLATCWHLDYERPESYPNPYAVSFDDGRTWHGPLPTGIGGNSTGLAALPDGSAAMLYTQRRRDPKGICLAIARPGLDGFHLAANGVVWAVGTATQSGVDAAHDNWDDFSFGEPAALPCADGTLLVVWWCIEPGFSGIRWARVRL